MNSNSLRYFPIMLLITVITKQEDKDKNFYLKKQNLLDLCKPNQSRIAQTSSINNTPTTKGLTSIGDIPAAHGSSSAGCSQYNLSISAPGMRVENNYCLEGRAVKYFN